ncbi:MAG: antibiotic biosynthesis monooxygenase [Thermomicrobiales bacterium]
MAFLFLSIHYPKPAHRDDVLRSMERVGETLRGAPGLLRIGPWKEEKGSRIVGLSIWESREAFERALAPFGAGAGDRSSWEERPAEEIFAEQSAPSP